MHIKRLKHTKKIQLGAITFLVMFAMLSMFSSQVIAQESETTDVAPAGYTPTPTAEILGNSEVLLIQDFWPWSHDSNRLAIIDVGKTYGVINSNSLAGTDLTLYKIVMIASDQPTSYYVNIDANIAKIEAFVHGGGVYIAHAADMGWHVGNWAGYDIMPGGVTHVTILRNDIQVAYPASPVVNGPYGVLNAAYFANWGASTHGWFTNVPPMAQIVMTTASTKPTYIVFNYGSGRVQATMQTIEWGYKPNGRGGPEFLKKRNRLCSSAARSDTTVLRRSSNASTRDRGGHSCHKTST